LNPIARHRRAGRGSRRRTPLPPDPPAGRLPRRTREPRCTCDPRHARGQGTVEYLIVLALVGVSLSAGPNSPLERLVGALVEHHARLTHAVSRP